MTDITNQQLLDEVNKTIQGFVNTTLTKDDAKNFLTKEDAKNFLTKDYLKDTLKDYPTKEDLKNSLMNYATKDDLTEALKDHPTKKNVREIVREEVADIRDEQLRQGVLIEDMGDKIAKLAEAIDEDLTTKTSVKDHEDRMNALEIKARMLTSTVRDHSAQIKNLQARKSRPLH